jgi:hypothetical protein
MLISKDYGILNVEDLAHYARNKPPRIFSFQKSSGGYNYWQCFPREKVKLYLMDMGYSSENFGWEDTMADLKIRIYMTPTVIHEYQMRRAYPVAEYKRNFTVWHKLMTNQKYVCLAGSFGYKKTVFDEGLDREIYYWTFEKIKTKKGSDCLLGL